MKKILLILSAVLISVLIIGLVASSGNLISEFIDTENSANEPDSPDNSNVISFSIDGVNYMASEGMTWGEWVNSYYGSSTIYDIYNTNVVAGSNKYVQLYGVTVVNTDKVMANVDYKVATLANFIMGSYIVDGEDRSGQFTFVEGMTWRDYCSSPYNTLNLSVCNWTVSDEDITVIQPADDDTQAVYTDWHYNPSADDYIIAGQYYIVFEW